MTDNGSGIPADEVELAFAHHATSKLREVDDLESMTSLGFRGEALPSIAAVGRVQMVTRPSDANVATRLELEEGRVVRQRKASAAPGTSVTVEALFSQMPARRKYLRSAAAETARVHGVVAHMALAFPSVQFTLRNGERVVLQTPGNGSTREVLAVVYGAPVAAAMLEVAPSQRGAYPVEGFIGPASVSRPSRAAINLFVNRRWVQSRALQAAVEEAYRGFLMEGRRPVAALFLDVPPAEVDVNVHPTKREVRFSREGDAFSSVQRAVRETLLAESPIAEPSERGRPTAEVAPDVPVMPTFRFTVPSEELAPPATFAPLHTEQPAAVSRVPETHMPALRVMGQMANTYVVAEGPDGMYLIDQHAAHEQVLFERVVRQWRERRSEVQALLEPLSLELTPEQLEVVEDALPLLKEYGFLLEPFGDGAWLVRAMPAMARQVPLPRLLGELLDLLRKQGRDGAPPHWALAASIACHSAVRAGTALDHQEMAALVRDLEMAENPRHCPHGRPTTIRMSIDLLNREFHRT